MKSVDFYKEEMMRLYRQSGQSVQPAATAPVQNPSPPAREQTYDNVGKLIVWVTTLRRLYAVQNARVTVYGENGEILDTAATDQSGRTRPFTLPTPPKNYSDDPEETVRPYATYRINVKADGYTEQELDSVVFPTVTSIQPVDMMLNSATNPEAVM